MEATIFHALDKQGMLTEEQKRLLVTGLLNEADFEKLVAARTYHDEPVLKFLLELPERPLTADEAIARLRLGMQFSQAVEESGGSVSDWSKALSSLEEAIPGITEKYVAGSARMPLLSLLVETVAPQGYTPERLVEKGKELTEQGLKARQLCLALQKEEPVPVHVLASAPNSQTLLWEYKDRLPDVPTAAVYKLISADIDTVEYRHYVKAGVEDIDAMISWSSKGVSGSIAERLHNEGEPQEEWEPLCNRLPLSEKKPWLTLHTRGNLTLRILGDLFEEGIPVEGAGRWDVLSTDAPGIRKEVGAEGWLELMRVGCSLAFLRQFSVLLEYPGSYAKPELPRFIVEEDGLLSGLLRLQEAGVDKEWARRYKVEVHGHGKQLQVSDYIDGWQNNRSAVRHWKPNSA
ncbi:hypothetical protein [Streptomyces tubercidicus]|uniref:hypothetical protein n=1 Tax=Streptomyces tubercidicus TaxID=47759 RepID=UPI0036CC635F